MGDRKHTPPLPETGDCNEFFFFRPFIAVNYRKNMITRNQLCEVISI